MVESILGAVPYALFRERVYGAALTAAMCKHCGPGKLLIDQYRIWSPRERAPSPSGAQLAT